jgi:anti-sigma regulatory factor (Ser/Thr protein kinase)
VEQLTLAASPRSPGEGRAFIAAFARARAVPEDVVEDAVLLVSEVVGNAYVHAHSAVSVLVDYRGGVLRVEVADDSPIPPQRRAPDLDATGGRGVLILDALAMQWGVRTTPRGKIVWFDIGRSS